MTAFSRVSAHPVLAEARRQRRGVLMVILVSMIVGFVLVVVAGQVMADGGDGDPLAWAATIRRSLYAQHLLEAALGLAGLTLALTLATVFVGSNSVASVSDQPWLSTSECSRSASHRRVPACAG